MLEGEDERASTTLRSSFLVPLARGWVIFALIAVAIGAGSHLMRYGFSSETIASVCVGFLVVLPAYGLVRQLGLALIIAFAVQGGMVVGSAALDLVGLVRLPLAAPLSFALVTAFLVADLFVERIRAGATGPDAAFDATISLLRPVAAGLVMAISVWSLVGLTSAQSARPLLLGLVLQLLVGTLFILVTVPAAASQIRYDETFLTRASRAREAYMALAYPLTFVAVDRWGLSLAGTWLVFATLSAFGAEPVIAQSAGNAVAWFAVLLPILACAILTAGAWRGAIACLLAEAVVVLLGFWAASQFKALDSWAVRDGVETSSAAFVLVMAVAARAHQARAHDEYDEAIARLRSIEDLAGVAAFATLGCIVAQLGSVPLDKALLAAVVASAGFAAALIFGPALATAISWLLPRRRSVTELYGKQ